jgi:hypothetical protein
MKFSIRYVLWMTALAAVLVAWWIDNKANEQARRREADTIMLLKKEATQNRGVIVVPHGWTPPPQPGGLRPIPGRREYQIPAKRPIGVGLS